VDAQTIKQLEQGVGSLATLITAMKALDVRLTGPAPDRTQAEQLRRPCQSNVAVGDWC